LTISSAGTGRSTSKTVEWRVMIFPPDGFAGSN
jgi:hypothetical protein